MKKSIFAVLVCMILVVSMWIPSAFAITQANIDAIVNTLNNQSDDTIVNNCKYLSDGNTIALQMIVQSDYAAFKDTYEADDSLKSALSAFVVQAYSAVRDTLDMADGKDVSVVTAMITLDGTVLFLNVNGEDAFWMLSK